MTRPTALALVLTLGVTAARGQEPPPPIRLELTPMPAPVPALKYYLFPQVRDQNPGNAVQLYYRAFNPESFGSLGSDPKQYNRLAELSDKPLRDLSPADLKELSAFASSWMLGEVDRAARRPNYDWELTDRLRTEGIQLRMPDVQSMRMLEVLLRMRAKVELSKGEFDKAAHTVQTGLAMGRQVANGPTLIQGLVGIAIASMTLRIVDDWVNLPDAPNLYWALTDLPHPLVDLRTGFEGERLLLDSIFPGYREMLADPTIPPPSPQQLQKTLKSLNDLQPSVLPQVEQYYPDAKKFLRSRCPHGRAIRAMPVLHAVFLYEDTQVRRRVRTTSENRSGLLPIYRGRRDRPPCGAGFVNGESSRRHDVAWELLPAVERVILAPARIERKIAALRCVEAIRLTRRPTAASCPVVGRRDRKVPIPLDPWTGKAFEYRLDGGQSFLSAPPPSGERLNPNTSIRYELTIRRAKGEK